MSLKKNIVANYISQLYVAGIGILILPLYIKYMGAEAYGLVGFFTMLQAWFALLDLGLTPTISRETARYRGGSMEALQYRQLFRALSLIFLAISLIGGSALFVLAEFIANQWLNVKELSIQQVVLAVQIMAISVALRWMSGLYRGVVTGFERLVWLSIFNVVIATLRFVAVFGSMYVYGFTPEVYFWHQLFVVLVEFIGLFLMGSSLLPDKQKLSSSLGWSFKPIRPLVKFALTVAFTSSVWVLTTQVDKMILSGILPLDEYGFFILAVMVATGVMILSNPVSLVIMPRMARLYAEKNYKEMEEVYSKAAQLVSVIAGSAGIVISFFSSELLFAWTGDRTISESAAPILRLYALGYGALSIAAFPYYLQYALGNLRYHVIGNLIIAMVLIPSITLAANYYGSIGAGWVWLGINFMYLICWVGYIHYKLVPGLHLKWMADIIKILVVPVLALFLYQALFNSDGLDRVSSAVFVFIGGLLCLLTSTLSSKAVRRLVLVGIGFNGAK